jgi:hypothetical protein
MEKQKLGYSLQEAAAVSSLSRRTLEYLIEQGQLKAVKINARTVIPARALEKLIELGSSRSVVSGNCQVVRGTPKKVAADSQTGDLANARN